MPSVTIYILLIVLPSAFSHYSDLSTDQNNERIIVDISDKNMLLDNSIYILSNSKKKSTNT